MSEKGKETKGVSRRQALKYGAAAVVVAAAAAGGYYYTTAPPPTPTQTATLTATQTVTATASPTVPLKLGVVSSSSPTDLSWTADAYDGMMFIKNKYNVPVDLTEYVSYADAERVVRDYTARGFNLVWAHGAQYEDAVMAVAPDYPQTYFVVTAGTKPDPPPNVITWDNQRYQGSYLLGVLAAMLTRTNNVASISGFDYPVCIRDHEGFKAGARATKSGIKATTVYAGTWSDPVKGKELATSLIEAGADIMWAQADLTNRGIIDACKAANVKMFFTDYDAWVLAPEIMVTSVLMNVAKAMDKTVSEILAGQWKGGYCWKPGLKEETVDLAPYHNFDALIPQTVKDTIETMKQDIVSGKLVVPLTYDKTS